MNIFHSKPLNYERVIILGMIIVSPADPPPESRPSDWPGCYYYMIKKLPGVTSMLSKSTWKNIEHTRKLLLVSCLRLTWHVPIVLHYQHVLRCFTKMPLQKTRSTQGTNMHGVFFTRPQGVRKRERRMSDARQMGTIGASGNLSAHFEQHLCTTNIMFHWFGVLCVVLPTCLSVRKQFYVMT